MWSREGRPGSCPDIKRRIRHYLSARRRQLDRLIANLKAGIETMERMEQK